MRKYTNEELLEMDVIDLYNIILKGDEIKSFPRKYWEHPEAKERATKCTRYLIETLLVYDENEIKEKLDVSTFINNKLGIMLKKCFNNSPYEAINSIYPVRFKEWELKKVSIGFWNNKENGIKVTKWLIEEKLKLTDDEVKEQLSKKLFEDNQLTSVLRYCFNNSPYKAINAVYPNKFKEWEFNPVTKGFWQDKENGIRATKWLIEEKLKLTDEQIKKQLSIKLFKDNGLGVMLTTCFNSNPCEAINTVYPNKYKEWELKYTPNNYWDNKENGIKATKWLIEEKLKLTEDQVNRVISIELFKDNGFGNMLKQCFNNSIFEALNATYPNKFSKDDFYEKNKKQL